MDVVAELSKLDLNLLVVLHALLAQRSVTRAAVHLGLTQPAVSNALARLRDALADPLLVRTPRGMIPTARALALETPLAHALAQLCTAIGEGVGFDPKTTRREFVVAATDYVQFVLLSELCERLRREAPHVTLHVRAITPASPVAELESGEVDLVLCGVETTQKGLARRSLFHDRVVCLLAADHPRAREPLTLARYLDLKHIEVLPTGGVGLADEVLERLGKRRSVVLTLPQFMVAPFVVQRSDHCFTLAERIARPLAKLLPLRVHALPFELPQITIWQYWHQREKADAAHVWLRRTIAEVAVALPKPARAKR
jgi:DNA-binding transcriptional LysR family regulator